MSTRRTRASQRTAGEATPSTPALRRSTRRRRPPSTAGGSEQVTRQSRRVHVHQESNSETVDEVEEEQVVRVTQRSTTPALADGEEETLDVSEAEASDGGDEDEDDHDDENESDAKGTEHSDNADGDDEDDDEDEPNSDTETATTSSGVELASDTSGSALSDAEVLAHTPPPGDYVPHHHWDTRLSSKIKRYQEASTRRARTHWSGLRTRLLGNKSPIARLAGVVRNLLSPSEPAASSTGQAAAGRDSTTTTTMNTTTTTTMTMEEDTYGSRSSTPTGDADLSQRLFAQSPSRLPRSSPVQSPMVLTISSRPRHPCARCWGVWGRPLGAVCGLLFMVALAWLLLALVPGLFEDRIVTGADRAAAAGGCSLDVVEKLVRGAHVYADEQVSACTTKCGDGLSVAAKNLTEIKLLLGALRQHHDGDMESANATVAEIQAALSERVAALDDKVATMLAQLAELQIQNVTVTENVVEVTAMLTNLRAELTEVQATIANPTNVPSFDWVKDYVEKELSTVLQRQASTADALRTGDKESLLASINQIDQAARSALDKANDAQVAAEGAQATADDAVRRADAAQGSSDEAKDAVSKLAEELDAVKANVGQVDDVARGAADAAAAAGAAAAEAKAAADGASAAIAVAGSTAAAGSEAQMASLAQQVDNARVEMEEKVLQLQGAVNDAQDAAAAARTIADEASTKAADAYMQATEGRTASGVSMPADVVQQVMAKLQADGGTQMPDYALASAGGSIVYGNDMLSKTLEPTPSVAEKVLCMIGLVPHRGQSPRDAIEPELDVGKCWPMEGPSGKLTVRLSSPGGVWPTYFTVDHAHHSVAHSLASAPRKCQVWAYRSEDDTEPVQMAEFEYSIHGAATQTFPRTMNLDNTEFFELMQLRIVGNWGNPYHTCLYRFRVHGNPKHTGSPIIE